VGLSPRAVDERGERCTRRDFTGAGCDLSQNDRDRSKFLVQTYARDTGAVINALTVPLFAAGERWGCALVGWPEEG
jgi:methyl-accepting chemotaxis protein